MYDLTIRSYADLIEQMPEPTEIRSEHEPDGREFYLLTWFPHDTMEYGRAKLYPTRNTVVLNDQVRLWIPLENIHIEVPNDSLSDRAVRYVPVGSGGHHYVSFADSLDGPVFGLKEALLQAVMSTTADCTPMVSSRG